MKELFPLLVMSFAIFSTSQAATTKQWAWLAGTFWYVPAKNLSAYTYSPITNTLRFLSDQTVFHITGYSEGYFYGSVVAQIDSNTPSCQSVIGSVTPDGKVYLTFNILPYSAENSPTIGLGTMVQKLKRWTMINQMSTGPNALQVGHWAYMVQTNPRQPSWNSLPGIGVSVPQFLSQCPDNSPR
ncbi:hypothetical protein [Methyloterricola oryzae]|uniref:hypothetical protein n=1 Tax=Methyloterricola oryzae TaxID=1495050 RepID=UPI0011AEF35E|nr:hypothetical protein [Methyloterricola oryzae]